MDYNDHRNLLAHIARAPTTARRVRTHRRDSLSGARGGMALFREQLNVGATGRKAQHCHIQRTRCELANDLGRHDCKAERLNEKVAALRVFDAREGG